MWPYPCQFQRFPSSSPTRVWTLAYYQLLHKKSQKQQPQICWSKNPQSILQGVWDKVPFPFTKGKKHKTVGATRSNQRGSNEICSLLIPVQSTTTKLQGVCNLVYTSTHFVSKETKYVWPDILLFIGKEDHGQKQILSSVQLYSSTIFLNCCQNRCKKNWVQECAYKECAFPYTYDIHLRRSNANHCWVCTQIGQH